MNIRKYTICTTIIIFFTVHLTFVQSSFSKSASQSSYLIESSQQDSNVTLLGKWKLDEADYFSELDTIDAYMVNVVETMDETVIARVYSTGMSSHLVSIDFSDTTNVKTADRLEIESGATGSLHDEFVRDSIYYRLYKSQTGPKVQSFDISNSSSLAELATLTLNASGFLRDARFMDNGHLLVSLSDTTSQIIDAKTPGSFNQAAFFDGLIDYVEDDKIFLSNHGQRKVVDISDPMNPNEQLSYTSVKNARVMSIEEDIIFSDIMSSTVKVVNRRPIIVLTHKLYREDISDPDNPVIDSLDMSIEGAKYPKNVIINNQYAYFVYTDINENDERFVYVDKIDVSVSGAMRQVDSLQLPTGMPSQGASINAEIVNKHLLLGGQSGTYGSLAVISLDNFEVVYSKGDGESGSGILVSEISDSRMYATEDGRLSIYDFSSPASPEKLGYYTLDRDYIRFLSLKGDLVVNAELSTSGEPDLISIVQMDSSLATNMRPTTSIPSQFKIGQNYPNPFNPQTVIPYALQSNTEVSIKIYNSLGQRVRTLINKRQAAGQHQVTFRADDLPSGVYFYTIQAGVQTKTRKMLLIK